MALTRKFLSALGIEADKIDEIIASHVEVVDGLKAKISTLEDTSKENGDYKTKYEKAKTELDELNSGDYKTKYEKAKTELDELNSGDYKTKYESEKKAFENYKNDIVQKETLSRKKAAYKKFLEGENVAEKAIDSILKISDYNSFEIDENGNIKDTTKLKEKVKTDYAGFVVEKKKSGANISTPPIGGTGKITSKADIYARDEHGRYKLSTEERQKAIAENPDLF